ncbi:MULTISPECIES: rod shape-determining protein [Kandleria]|jgi:rod shape-determining protein MreB|uniref:Cell shape-determining protein MreB n=2 Tax=Kandleria vitulina TaxID=1630 RepID=A0A0R2HBH8_9FIRM|nr:MULTISPECIES: rod shape-determining protein [Kandleria]KRN49662.1 rod shape-determining protein MreB [Kandleria vitulina DSM 20405]MBP3275754.1 rod shape-determining protein [Kandleria sp.]MEE0989232.1 rod shape-determining protein [Kandleria vitulina]SDM01113.1 rod shape-determining protein MreB [Kandleria vitulina]SDW59913.1 rod shape-determining protein MreB [Kandleria vitulina]
MALSKEIGIDLGTANILIYRKGEGIVVNEPSVVTINTETNRAVAVGEEAREMLGKTPGKLQAIRPLKDGVIADFQITEILLTHFINKLNLKGLFSRPTILICCPSNITSIEKSAIQDVALRCGAKKVYIEEEPKVAAIGAGLDISKPTGNMVVDIGGGTTDIAVLSLGDIVTSQSLKTAGDKMDSALVAYVKDKYKLLIGDSTAEQIKKEIGCACDADPSVKFDVRGRDMVTGLPKTIQMSEDETEDALHELCETILESAKQVLEQTPPELAADIVNKGVFLTGGGAQLHGLDKFMEQGLKVPVFVAENPLDCVADGCGVMLENTDYLQ